MKLARTAAVWVLVAAATATAAAEEIRWHVDVDEARRVAQEQNRPIMAYFTSSNCPHCVRMKQVFAEEAVAAEVGRHFVPLWMDYGTDPSKAGEYRVRSFPTIVILRGDGTEVRRLVGYVPSPSLLTRFEQIESAWVADRPQSGTTVK